MTVLTGKEGANAGGSVAKARFCVKRGRRERVRSIWAMSFMRPIPLVKFTTHIQYANGNRHKIQNYQQGKIEALHIDSILGLQACNENLSAAKCSQLAAQDTS
jgi:hypothetical protein